MKSYAKFDYVALASLRFQVIVEKPYGGQNDPYQSEVITPREFMRNDQAKPRWFTA